MFSNRVTDFIDRLISFNAYDALCNESSRVNGLDIRQLLKIPRFSKIEEIFFKLLCGLRFSPKSFYFFFNRIARYAQSKESRNLSSEIPQTTYKAIFRSCHKQ